MHRTCTPIVFCLLAALSLSGQGTQNLRFRHLNIDNGLSHNIVYSVCQDSLGYYWIGTHDGLNRFDGYDVKVFTSDPLQKGSIAGNHISVVYVDRSGDLWLAIYNYGLNRYDRENDRFINFPGDSLGLRSSRILDLYEDTQGNLWIGTQGGVDLMPHGETRVKNIPFQEERMLDSATSSAAVFTILEDHEGTIWLGTYNGLNRVDPETFRIRHFFPTSSSRFEGGKNWIRGITEGWDGNLWLVGQTGFFIFDKQDLNFRNGFELLGIEYDRNIRGMNDILIDRNGRVWFAGWEGAAVFIPATQEINYLRMNRNDPLSFPQGSTLELFLDNIGGIWLGTWNRGASYHNSEISKFGLISKNTDPDGLSGDFVRCVITDNRENLWIGIDLGGLNYYDRTSGNYTYYTHEPDNPNSLVHDNVRCLLLDKQNGQLWIGTQRGLDVLNPERKQFTHYQHDPGNLRSIVDNDIRCIAQDFLGDIWIGTHAGLTVYRKRAGTFENYTSAVEGSLSDDRITFIYEDADRQIWIGTQEGLNRFDRKRKTFQNYRSRPTDPQSLGSSYITCMHEDKKGRFWIGTYGGGINRFQRDSGYFERITMNNGLPSNVVYGILEDALGTLWLSTNKGISRFDPENRSFTNFDKEDGLQSNQFYFNAYHKTASGEFLFGGVRGLNYFRPENIRINLQAPQVIITDLKLFNESVGVSENDGILRKHISITDSITLSHQQSVLSFDFVAIHLGQPGKIEYAYILEGLEDHWNYVGKKRSATYTNLNAGDYVFRVKASNGNDVWNTKGAAVHLTMLPPWWETLLFRIFLGISVVVIIYILVLMIRNREKLKADLRLERIKAERDREIDAMKLNFYSNISHEFRTPLTLIIGPVENMISNPVDPSETRSQLNIVRKNARRLLRLINQLLDLSRIESGYMKLSAGQDDLIESVEEIASSFNYNAEKLGIRYTQTLKPDSYQAWFDRDKIEKILYNLLSNAFKYTAEGGSVSLKAEILCRNHHHEDLDSDYLQVRVTDTGKGIPAERLDKIFDRFYQDEKASSSNPGTGIGLTLSRQLAEIHKGRIDVESSEQKGSEFTLTVPVSRSIFQDEELAPEKVTIHEHPADPMQEPSPDPTVLSVKEPGKNRYKERRPMVLLIDDNPDIREYIHTHLGKDYGILLASDGDEGLEQARTNLPDLIICDVMMPGIGGFELCRKLKSDKATGHIPFIFLTARPGIEDKIRGLQAGAEDYVIKPFQIEEIRLKVKNLLRSQKDLRERISKVSSLSPSDVDIDSADENFLRRAIEIIETHMEDSEFNIKSFSEKIGVSRMQLYRKIHATTNQTVKTFIRRIRLERAAQLLQKRAYTINEIAYMVGFREISYFRKCFKDQYGVTPSDYISRHARD